MTYAARRLAELEVIGRTRPLTDAEQREVLLRAKQERRNNIRRRLYWLDEDYHRREVERVRTYREARA